MKLSRDGSQLAIVGQGGLTIVDVNKGIANARHVHSRTSGDKFWHGDWTAAGRHFLTSVSIGRAPLGPEEFWSLPVDGGAPVRQALPFGVRGVWVSRDGTQVAWSAQKACCRCGRSRISSRGRQYAEDFHGQDSH